VVLDQILPIAPDLVAVDVPELGCLDPGCLEEYGESNTTTRERGIAYEPEAKARCLPQAHAPPFEAFVEELVDHVGQVHGSSPLRSRAEKLLRQVRWLDRESAAYSSQTVARL